MIPQYEDQITVELWKTLMNCNWYTNPPRPNKGWGIRRSKAQKK